MSTKAYNEETLVKLSRHGRMLEVYGQDGWGWYAYRMQADAVIGRSRGIVKSPSVNGVFTRLDGMTRRKLVAKGFSA